MVLGMSLALSSPVSPHVPHSVVALYRTIREEDHRLLVLYLVLLYLLYSLLWGLTLRLYLT